MSPKAYRRGYPVAILVGLEEDQAVLWQIFSQVAKHQQSIPLIGGRNDSKAVYNFHESIVNALRSTLKEGVRSLMLASPPRTNYAQEFQNHVKSHHSWLVQGPNRATFSTITGSASTPAQIATLTKTATFKQLISETTAEETENLLEILEKKLNEPENLVSFSLVEVENMVFDVHAAGKPQPDYLLLTDTYLSSSRQKNRVHRLIQVAKNRGVKTKIVNAESAAGKRLAQFGGIVCLAKLE
jgi:stalled ribosome rescue protein Dom34